MTEPIWPPMAASRRAGGVRGIGAVALADLLGHWPAADGPLYRLLAARIARLADTGELSAGLRLPPEPGLPADPAEVIVTPGGQQALDLLIRCEVLPGQPVVVEDPTFPGALDALYRAGARVLGIPAGAGLDPDRLEHVVRTHRPAMVYLIPTHHNPTGLVMPAGHRRRMARLAAAYPDPLFVDDLTKA